VLSVLTLHRFQYVSCQFDALRRHRAPAKIRQALKDLPKGLDATYDRILNSIDPEYQKQVASILKWLAFSVRPLLLEELAEAFILDLEKPVPFDETERLFNPEDVLTYLPGLVVKVPIRSREYREEHLEWEREDKVVHIRFAHFSVKEYLSSSRMTLEYFSSTEQISHLHISEYCLAYHLQLSENLLATEDTVRQYHLWKYAMIFWDVHLEKVARRSWTASVIKRATDCFATKSQSLLNIARTYDPDGRSGDWQKRTEVLAAPLYYAASRVSIQLASLLIDNGADVNEISPLANYGTALNVALYHKKNGIVRLLIDCNADIHEGGGKMNETALYVATCVGSQDNIELLLDRGADINTQGGFYGTALQAAAWIGLQEIVQLLLEHGAEVNTQGGFCGNALLAAIAGNNGKEIAKLLLSRGAKISEPGKEWEELLVKIAEDLPDGKEVVRELRDFQHDPTGYLGL